jgi:hypothetical protein
MFGLFRKKTEEELKFEAFTKGIKQSIKEIQKNKGSYAEVCINFIKFTKDDELFSGVGLIWDKLVPHKKLHVMHASLMLLTALKTKSIKEDKDNFLYDVAKFSFLNSTLIMSTEEMQPLLADLDLLKQKKEELKETTEHAWKGWDEMEPSLLQKIIQI